MTMWPEQMKWHTLRYEGGCSPFFPCTEYFSFAFRIWYPKGMLRSALACRSHGWRAEYSTRIQGRAEGSLSVSHSLLPSGDQLVLPQSENKGPPPSSHDTAVSFPACTFVTWWNSSFHFKGNMPIQTPHYTTPSLQTLCLKDTVWFPNYLFLLLSTFPNLVSTQ